MRRLVIVPGFGDREWVYRLAIPFWWLRGFKVKVWKFNWRNDDRDFNGRLLRLLGYINSIDGMVYVVGVSAGGTVAANVLFMAPNVHRAVAICSPIGATNLRRGMLLDLSLENLHNVLRRADIGDRSRLLSLLSRHDTVVAAENTKVSNVPRREIPGATHARSIARALTIGAGPIAAWLKAGK